MTLVPEDARPDDDLRPDVSVVIPTRNRWPLLARALRGALAQEGVALEVLVVDDGSSDETAERLAAEIDQRVSVLRNDVSSGVARARNRGIGVARGRWVAFLDDDDVWAPDKLAAQLGAMNGAGWAWTAAIAVDEGLRPLRLMRAPEPDGVADALLMANLIPALSSVIVRTDLLRDAGGFDESFSALADWDLWIRVARLAPGSSCPRSLVGYVEHGTNMLAGAADPMEVRPEFDRLASKHAAAAAASGVTFGGVWWARWVASHHRLRGRRLQASHAYLRGAWQHRTAGDALRAVGALGGQRVWRRMRDAIGGSTEEPAWLERHRSP